MTKTVTKKRGAKKLPLDENRKNYQTELKFKFHLLIIQLTITQI